MKPFLILQLRPETDAADNEFEAFLSKGALSPDRVHRIRLDCEPLPTDLDLGRYAGTIVGGGPGCVSDPPEKKTEVEARIEHTMLSLMPQITEGDLPFLGCCYGIGILAHHLGAEVSKKQFGEPVGTSLCRITEDGAADPLLAGLPQSFEAFVGHKEAAQDLPDGAAHLLASDACPFQMIRHGANVYATQFHPEADAAGFHVRIDIYRHRGYFRPEEADDLHAMIDAAKVHAPELILRNFVARYG
ncbi:glutamine amidotransferase [Psychromarinibacter sp. S121]|uniref:glutamine amidotransferase n=1 Tax=Psychromarinibacter sp. S121 TaxID=3415127 RepID=UPI003C7CA24A